MKNEMLLSAALQHQGMHISRSQKQQFTMYHHLLLEWNQRMNLISKKDEVRIYSRHFLESVGLLFTVRFPLNSWVMDLGSGAGLPGIPMKIIRPDLKIILAESIQKKAAFLEAIQKELMLDNIQVFHGRAEDFNEKSCFDFVVCRSVSNLIHLSQWSRPLLKAGGMLVAIKGSSVTEELDQLNKKSKSLQIKACRNIPFNPFPEIIPLEHQRIVTVHFSRPEQTH